MSLKSELKRKIVAYRLPSAEDGLAHITYESSEGKKYQADVTAEELKERLSLRKLLETMTENQIELLEIYLDAKNEAEEKDKEYEEE